LYSAKLRVPTSCELKMKKRALGILLSTGPDNPNLTTAIGLSHAALKEGIDVYLYLIDEGVLTVDDPRFQPLRDSGLKLFACAYGAQRLGVPRKDDKATYCGLVVLSNIVSTCDRFIPLN
jgi:sulfur relay (sulfurtransferase) complex TusBCD TusD component (DsrE family)